MVDKEHQEIEAKFLYGFSRTEEELRQPCATQAAFAAARIANPHGPWAVMVSCECPRCKRTIL